MAEIEVAATDAMRLDGNAAAGLLDEIFRCEPSSAIIVCNGCEASAPLGTLLAYGLEMGVILRCPHCDSAILRAGVTGQVRWLDLRGAARMRLTTDS